MDEPVELTVVRAGFAAVPFWVVDALGAGKDQALFVYIQLCAMSNYKTRITRSSYKEVVEKTRLGRSTVLRALSTLRDVGAVVRVGDELHLPLDSPSCGTDRSQLRDRPVPVAGPDGGGTIALHKDSENTYSDSFLRAWQTYPRKDNKRGAWKAWQARVKAGADTAAMSAGAADYAKRMKGKEPQFIMLGATFFGPNERYLDFTGSSAPEGYDLEAARLWMEWWRGDLPVEPDCPCPWVTPEGKPYKLDSQGHPTML